MLDPTTPVSIPGTDLIGYADLDAVELLWACPRAPRPALAADGHPDVQLLLYRHGTSGPIEGGQFSLTVDLALSPAESAAAQATATARRRTASSAAASGGEPAPARWQSLSWRAAAVTVSLAPQIQLSGTGSLIGNNSATLSLMLDGETASRLDSAWAAGFPDATATAEVEVDAMTSSSTGSAVTTAAAEAATGGAVAAALRAYHQTTATTRLRVARPLQLTLSGPLRLPTTTDSNRRTVITL